MANEKWKMNSVLAFPISFENFKTVAGQRCQILQGNGSFKAVKLQTCRAWLSLFWPDYGATAFSHHRDSVILAS
jgi:hypothetical protein